MRRIKVIAKYQIAYESKLYLGGQVIEMLESDYPEYANDVRLPDFRLPKTKPAKAVRARTKRVKISKK